MNRDKINDGGIYLVNLSGNVNPEFGLKHYCVLVHTHDKELYLAFPTTTSRRREAEKWTKVLKIDNSIVLLKHVRIIAKNRIIGELRTNGILNVLDEIELDELLSEYERFIQQAHINANKSVKRYHKEKSESLECVSSLEINVGETIDYNSLITKSKGGTIVHNNINTSNAGEKIISFIIKDDFNQKIKRDVMVTIRDSN